ncbi:hypothetical protein, partial [Nosocomiicoccus sp. HMSC059G07]|uniref:hypothetical protein n=1 Tax=Nosocomiicoccus sp. HMSC059G07 TaxID=1739531 RepID=UPI001438C5EB
ENEQSHRHVIDKTEQEKFHKNNYNLTVIGIIASCILSMTGVIGGIVLAIIENTIAGSVVSVLSLGSIIANILKASKNQNL